MFLTDKGYDFDNSLPTKYWSLETRVNFLQRVVILNSMIYYKLNTMCMEDKVFDAVAKQLVLLTQELSEVKKQKTHYWYVMYDFDGSTGFDLYDRLSDIDKNYLLGIANQMVTICSLKPASDNIRITGQDNHTTFNPIVGKKKVQISRKVRKELLKGTKPKGKKTKR